MSSVGDEARALRGAIAGGAVDLAAAAREARAMLSDVRDDTRARWLDLELAGYGALSDARRLHEVLGTTADAPLTLEVAGYRTQVGRRWADPDAGTKVAHFFVESLDALLAARDRVRSASASGLIELAFDPHPSAPRYPRSAEFPVDVFDRILDGFASALLRALEATDP